MFYVYELPRDQARPAISLDADAIKDLMDSAAPAGTDESGEPDIDFVDDSLLNTAPHNKIEQQLLRGDVVGLALMSGAILWSAMGAFG